MTEIDSKYSFLCLEDMRNTDSDRYQEFVAQTVKLLNSEWPRSETARIHSLTSTQSLKPKNHLLLVTNPDNQVVGHCRIVAESILDQEIEFFVESVTISKSLRGHGLGRHLMDQVEKFICQKVSKYGTNKNIRCVKLTLDTVDDAATNFYFKLGFKISQNNQKVPNMTLTNVQEIENQNVSPRCPVPAPPPPMPIASTPKVTSKCRMYKMVTIP